MEKVRVEREIGGQTFSLETGFIAKQAGACVLAQFGDTVVLNAVTSGSPREGIDFFPLMCDYRERFAAAGKFPGGFLKREGRPSTKDTLTSRLTDRPIRPLFPKGFKDEVMCQSTVVASDGLNDGDVIAMNGIAAALHISPLPFDGPIASVRVGRIDGQLVTFPTVEDLEESDLDMIVSGSLEEILMIEGFAREMPEDEMVEAILYAHEGIKAVCELQNELHAKCNVVKQDFVEPEDDGLADIDEFSLGTAPNDPVSDEDGLKDGAEVSEYKTDPKSSDTDNDGITDGDEISGENGFVTLPNNADSDGDGLKDGDEVKNHSTDPLKTDTDGDGSDDGYEVNRFFDPLDASINPSTLLADSYDEFSGIQGQDDWQYGYRNLTLDGGDIESYDAENDFIAFDDQEHWRPGWRLAPSAAPWTLFNGPEGSHPNGTNSAPNEEHWTVRRWTADELTSETPIGLKWHTRKTNLNGTGVTGSLFVNGEMVDSASFAGNDGVGQIRTWYANLNPGDVVDLALTPVGPDGNSTDGSDGSANWLRVDTYIPIGAEQPDGSPFLAALKQGLQISDVFFDKSNKTIVVSWPSGNGRSYALDISSGLLDSIEDGSWEEYDDSIPGEADETTYEVIIEDELPKRLFIRVRDITD